MPMAGGQDGPEAEPRIGAQLRAARHAARKSMAEVAEQSGLTKGFLSKLERDLTSVSVASLMRLCEALGISVGSLFQAAKGEVVRKGEYPPINFGGNAGAGVPAHARGREARPGHPERHRAGRRQRRRALLAADRRGVRLRAGRPAAHRRGGRAPRPGRRRRLHLPVQRRAHLPGARRRPGRPRCCGSSRPPCPTTASTCSAWPGIRPGPAGEADRRRSRNRRRGLRLRGQRPGR